MRPYRLCPNLSLLYVIALYVLSHVLFFNLPFGSAGNNGVACCRETSPGSYFGERALLSEETRKATCVALAAEGTVCLSLGELSSRLLGSLGLDVDSLTVAPTSAKSVTQRSKHEINALYYSDDIVRPWPKTCRSAIQNTRYHYTRYPSV